MDTISCKHTTSPNGERKQRAAVVVLCTLLSAAAVLPFFLMGRPEGGRRWWWNDLSVRTGRRPASLLKMPATHDMYQHLGQMESFYRGLQAGEVYPRWEEDTNHGFGAPTTIYYPPGLYYLTSAMFALVRDWGRAVACSIFLMMIASAACFYLYARRFFSRLAAVIAMAAYIMLPYHLIDQYQRGALAELLSFVWIPLILLFADRLLTPLREPSGGLPETAKAAATRSGWLRQVVERIPDFAGLAICYAAFIWSHVPTAYQFTLVAAVSLPVLAYLRKTSMSLVPVGIAAATGLGLAGAYLFPAILEESLIHGDRVYRLFPYNKSFAFALEDLGLGALHEFNSLINESWMIGVAAMLLCGLILIKVKDVSPDRRRSAMFWLVMGGFASFMMTPVSIPLSKIIPKLETGVYSWRLLSILTMVGALCVGLCAEEAFAHSGLLKAPRSVLAAVSATLILSFCAAFSITQVMAPMGAFEAFEPSPEHLNDIIMPRNVDRWPAELPVIEQPAGLLGQKGEVSIRRWEPQHREMGVVSADPDRLVIRTFNFPGWTATVDGRQVSIEDFGPIAAIMFEVPAGSHVVTLDFLDTRDRRIGKGLTLASFITLLTMIAFRSLAIVYARNRHARMHAGGPNSR